MCISCTEFQTCSFLFPCEGINNFCLLLSSRYEIAVVLCYVPLRGAKSLQQHQLLMDTGALGFTGVLAAAEHTVLGRAELQSWHCSDASQLP